MPEVFISYSHEDAAEAKLIREVLSEAGISIWQDVERMSSGQPLTETIAKVVEQVKFVVAVLSPHSERSQWFRWEIDTAITVGLQRGYPKLLPIKISPCTTPPNLIATHHVDATGDVRAGARHIASVIQKQGRLFSFGGAHVCNLWGEDRDCLLDFLESAFPSPQLAVMFWRQLSMDGEPAQAVGDSRQTWSAFIDLLAGSAKLGSFLRLVQQLLPDQADTISRIRRQRVIRVLSPGSSVEGFTPFSKKVEDLKDFFRFLTSDESDAGELLRPSTAETEYRVALVGAFSAGKSTLINAMLRRPLLPEMNMACTPCPTAVHTAARGAEKLVARLISEDELESAVHVVMGRLGLLTDDMQRLLFERNWGSLLRAVRTAEDDLLVLKERAALDEFLLPALQAAAQHHELLGSQQEFPLDQLKLLRAGKDAGAVPHVLLREIEVWAHCPGSVPGLCLIDTPGVTSQNPAHKDAAFKVVTNCHVLLVVESFDSPLIKGPDELMDAFYSRIIRDPSENRSDEKVFVVLNKCDQAHMGVGGAPAPEITETVEKVAKRYTSAWGVPEQRIFAISALVAFDEVSGGSRGIPSFDVDMLLMFFRNFQASIERYVLDRLVKNVHLDMLDDLASRTRARRATISRRMDLMEATGQEQKALIERQQEALVCLQDARKRAAERIPAFHIEQKPGVLTALNAVLDGLHKRTLAELGVEQKEFMLGKATFVRWMDAVLHDELARTLSASLTTWGKRWLPVAVTSHLKAVVAGVHQELSRGSASIMAHDLLVQGADIPEPSLPKAFARLTSVEAIRTLWDTSGTPRGNLASIEGKLKMFFLGLREEIQDGLDAIASDMARSREQHALFEIDLLERSLEESLSQTQDDLQRTYHHMEDVKARVRAKDADLLKLQERTTELRGLVEAF